MKQKLTFIIVLVVAIVSIIYSLSGGLSPEQHAEEIAKHRDETDRFMKFSDESPFSQSDKKYEGLKYFEPNLKYRIKARFESSDDQKPFTLETNDGKQKQYLTYGTAYFELDNKKESLLILENVEEEELFLAFGDETSAISTYGAGRYLDVTHSGGNSILLEFNKAYNPFCAYVDDYTCPLPPRQNLLEVAILAGEKTYN